jgi:hypothetical protein
MGRQEVKLNKQVFGKVSYPKVIDTEFSQLVKPEGFSFRGTYDCS